MLKINRYLLESEKYFCTRGYARVFFNGEESQPKKKLPFGFIFSAVILLVVFVYLFQFTQNTFAAATSTINFQARLEGSDGAIVPDGCYNVEFKLYSASSGGTNYWTEDYLNTNSGTCNGTEGGVEVSNGYLTANLGSVNPFSNASPAIPWSQQLYLGINIGGTTDSGSPTWDGEMSPRLLLTAVPYAFQSEYATSLQTTSGSDTSTLSFATPTANDTITIPADSSSDTVCLVTLANCSGSSGGSGDTHYIENQTSLQSSANFDIQSSSIGSTTGIIEALSGQTAGLLDFVNSNYNSSPVAANILSGFNNNGQLYYTGTTGDTGTITAPTLSGNVTYTLPSTSGTICLDSSTSCGFAASSGSGSYINNSSSPAQTANFNITGTGQAGTSFLSPLFDVASGTLQLGTSTASAISIGQSGITTTNNGPLTVTGLLTANGGLTSTAATNIDTTGSSALNIGTGSYSGDVYIGNNGAITTLAGNSSSNITFTNFSVSGAGAVVGVGVNSGSGLLQGTGGLTLTGAANINTSGSSATNVGTGSYSGSVTVGNSSASSVKLQASSNNSLLINSTGTAVAGIFGVAGYTTTNTSNTYNGEWTELGTCTITSQFQDCNTELHIIGGGSGSVASIEAVLSWRVKQQAALGSAPLIQIVMNNEEYITSSNIMAVTTENDGTATVVQLWGQDNQSYDDWHFTPYLENNGGGTLAWLNNSGFSASLPAGTQTSTQYDDINGNSLSVVGSSTLTGAANINISGSSATNVGTGSYSGTLALGNSSSTTAVKGNSSSSIAFTNFNVASNGLVTLLGGLAPDITTATASTANTIGLQPGVSSSSTGSTSGATLTLQGGNDSGAPASGTVTGGTLSLLGGNATGASGTRDGGSVTIDAGTGATANGNLNIGTSNSATTTLGRTGGTTTINGNSSSSINFNSSGFSVSSSGGNYNLVASGAIQGNSFTNNASTSSATFQVNTSGNETLGSGSSDGLLTFVDGSSSDNGVGLTLQSSTTTAFTLYLPTDSTSSQSANVCVYSATYSINNCGFATSSADGSYIENQNSSPQSANFDISGTGESATSLVTAANGLTLGTASSHTGGIVFDGSGGAGMLTLVGPTTPNPGNYILTIPTITANDTICTNGTMATSCPNYASSTGSNNYIQNSGSGLTLQSSAYFNISGTGEASILLANTINLASGSTLSVGTIASSTLDLGNSGATAINEGNSSSVIALIGSSSSSVVLGSGSSEFNVAANGYVGVGSAASSSTAQLIVINATSSNNAIEIQGATSQSANLVTIQNSNSVTLTALDSSGNYLSYNTNATYNSLATPTIAAANGDSGSSYYYVVTAVDNQGQSLGSNVLGESTDSGDEISWSSINGATSYDIYRSSTTNFTSGNHLIYGNYMPSSFSSPTFTDAADAVSAGTPPTASILPPTIYTNAGAPNPYCTSGCSTTYYYGVTAVSAASSPTGLSALLYTPNGSGSYTSSSGSGTSGYYAITAVNDWGVESTPTSLGVVAPTGGASGTHLVLTWTAVSGAVSYNIYYNSSNSFTTTGLLVGSTQGATFNAYSNTSQDFVSGSAAPPTYNATIESGMSNVVASSTDLDIISWDSIAGATSYNIYRNTSPSFNSGSLYLTNTSSDSYTDGGSATSTGLPPVNITNPTLTASSLTLSNNAQNGDVISTANSSTSNTNNLTVTTGNSTTTCTSYDSCYSSGNLYLSTGNVSGDYGVLTSVSQYCAFLVDHVCEGYSNSYNYNYYANEPGDIYIDTGQNTNYNLTTNCTTPDTYSSCSSNNYIQPSINIGTNAEGYTGASTVNIGASISNAGYGNSNVNINGDNNNINGDNINLGSAITSEASDDDYVYSDTTDTISLLDNYGDSIDLGSGNVSLFSNSAGVTLGSSPGGADLSVTSTSSNVTETNTSGLLILQGSGIQLTSNGTNYVEITTTSSTATEYSSVSTFTINPGSSSGSGTLILGGGGTNTVDLGPAGTGSITSTANILTNSNTGSTLTVNIGSTSSAADSVNINGGSTNGVSIQSAGALTLTATAASTWSTSSGELTVQSGNGALSLGSTGTLTNGTNLTISPAAALTLTAGTYLTAGLALTLNGGSANYPGSSGGNVAVVAGAADGAGTNGSVTINVASVGTATRGAIDIGNITGTIGSIQIGNFTDNPATSIDAGALTITAAGASIWKTSAGNLTVEAATTNTLILDSASSGGAVTLGTNATTLTLGSGNTAYSINIGTASTSTAVKVTIGTNSSTTAQDILQAGAITITTGQGGVVIGYGTTGNSSNLVPLYLSNFSTFAETTNTCTSSVNNGALYYNSNSSTVRGCINGSWQDIVSTQDFALQLFGVVPNSGSNSGDLIGASASSSVGSNTGGPCKVNYDSNTAGSSKVYIDSCLAYSGGRLVSVSAGAVNLATTNTNGVPVYQSICLNSSGSVVASTAVTNITSIGGNLTTTNATTMGQPLLCFAVVELSSASPPALSAIYDVRTFTTTDKTYATDTTAPGSAGAAFLGGVVTPVAATSGTVTTTTASTNIVQGVIVANSGSAGSAGSPNLIIATSGPQWVDASSGTANDFVDPSSTTGIATGTSTTGDNAYEMLGVELSTYGTSCTAQTYGATDCNASDFVYLNIQ